MTRTWKLALALTTSALVAAGCKAPAPSIDPFFGRSTVPPPALGGAAPPPADNAYYSAAPAGASAGSGGTAAQPVARRQSDDTPERVAPRPAARSLRSANPDEAPPRETTRQADSSTAGHRLTGTRRGTAQDAESEAAAPARFAAQGPLRGIDPPADTDSVQQAGFVELPARGASEVRRGGDRAYAAGSLRYDRAEDYSWLSGRLEYSPTGDQWKLRYIPIDGATDDYGGSVIVADEAAVRDYRSGSFVTVYGQVEGRNADARVFAPYYRVQSVESAE